MTSNYIRPEKEINSTSQSRSPAFKYGCSLKTFTIIWEHPSDVLVHEHFKDETPDLIFLRV